MPNPRRLVCTCLFPCRNYAKPTGETTSRQSLTQISTYSSIPIPPYRLHLVTPHSLAGPPRFTPALQPIRTTTLPPTYRLVTPSLRLLSCILLYNVRFLIPHPLSPTRTSPFPHASRPKKGPPLQEIAVALIASLLGGFGTVAMFCTLGVYVYIEREAAFRPGAAFGFWSRVCRVIFNPVAVV